MHLAEAKQKCAPLSIMQNMERKYPNASIKSCILLKLGRKNKYPYIHIPIPMQRVLYVFWSPGKIYFDCQTNLKE